MLNDFALLNIQPISVTLDTSHLEMSLLKDFAFLNIQYMLVTLDTSHFDRSALKNSYGNNLSVLVTRDTSHPAIVAFFGQQLPTDDASRQSIKNLLSSSHVVGLTTVVKEGEESE